MQKDILWRFILIFIVLFACIFFLYPPEKKIRLGLDLKGGSHLVLEVQTKDALVADRNDAFDFLQEKLKKEGIVIEDKEFIDEKSFSIKVPQDRLKDASTLVEENLPGWDLSRTSDKLIIKMRASTQRDREELAIRQALETIRNRVDALGLAEPTILRQGTTNRIVVQLPGVDDPERVKDIIKATAVLELKLVDKGPTEEKEALIQAYGGNLPNNLEILPAKERGEGGRRAYYTVEKKASISGRDLKNAKRGVDRYGKPNVQFSLNASGSKKFSKVTGENVGRRLAIVLDNQIMSAPVIKDKITTPDAEIEGNFTIEEAEDLALVLRSGSLPASVVYLEERTVGPSLGRDSIERGIKSGILGLLLIMVFMFFYYRLSGLNSIVALILNIIILLGIVSYLKAVLTLPGIAGIILTVGMAVDSNVLIFERIREELLAGKSIKAAISLGFSRALATIIDSNLTTIIAGLFLFQFGTGPIKGFAITLIVGLLASMFTAVFVSRTIFDFFYKYKERVKSLSI